MNVRVIMGIMLALGVQQLAGTMVQLNQTQNQLQQQVQQNKVLGGLWAPFNEITRIFTGVRVAFQDLASGKWLRVGNDNLIQLNGSNPTTDMKCQFKVVTSTYPPYAGQAFRLNNFTLKTVSASANPGAGWQSAASFLGFDTATGSLKLGTTAATLSVDALASGPDNALWLRVCGQPGDDIGSSDVSDGNNHKVFNWYFKCDGNNLKAASDTKANGNTSDKNADGTVKSVATLGMYIIQDAIFWPDEGFVQLTPTNAAALPAGSFSLNRVVQIQRTSTTSLDAALQLAKSSCLDVDASGNLSAQTMADDQIANYGDKFIPEAIAGGYYLKAVDGGRYVGKDMKMTIGTSNAAIFTITPAKMPTGW